MSPRAKGYLAALTAITLWATTGILIRYLVADEAMPPMLLAWWRNILISAGLGVGLALFAPARLRFPARQGGFLAGYGLVLALFNAVWIFSVQANGAAVATVLLYSSAGFTALVGHWWFRESLGVPKALAIALSLGGCVLVSGAYTPAQWHLHAPGLALGLASGLMFAAYSLGGRAASRRGLDPWTTLFWAFGVASVLLAGFNAAVESTVWLPRLSPFGWGMLVVLALFPTLLGFVAYNAALVYLEASVVNLLATLEPVMTAIMAAALLGEHLSAIQVGGSALILLGMVLVQLERPAAAPPTAAPAP